LLTAPDATGLGWEAKGCVTAVLGCVTAVLGWTAGASLAMEGGGCFLNGAAAAGWIVESLTVCSLPRSGSLRGCRFACFCTFLSIHENTNTEVKFQQRTEINKALISVRIARWPTEHAACNKLQAMITLEQMFSIAVNPHSKWAVFFVKLPVSRQRGLFFPSVKNEALLPKQRCRHTCKAPRATETGGDNASILLASLKRGPLSFAERSVKRLVVLVREVVWKSGKHRQTSFARSGYMWGS